MIIMVIAIIVFMGIWIYGILSTQRSRKRGEIEFVSKCFWIGWIGVNVCSLSAQVCKMIYG